MINIGACLSCLRGIKLQHRARHHITLLNGTFTSKDPQAADYYVAIDSLLKVKQYGGSV